MGGLNLFLTLKRICDDHETNNCDETHAAGMETSFLIQPWITTRTITDYCRLCFQARESGNYMPCKRSLSLPYNSLLASLRMEPNPEFGDIMKHLEEAKETCLSSEHPDEHCHEKMQTTLQAGLRLFDQMLEDYKSKYVSIQNRITPLANM